MLLASADRQLEASPIEHLKADKVQQLQFYDEGKKSPEDRAAIF